MIANGRHFRLCKLNSKTLFHNNMRDELFLMCRSAGIPTIKEPENLLPDEPLQRPGDIYFPCWSTNSSTLTKHAIDFTAPSADASWDTLPIVQQLLRSSTSGSTASASITRKLTNKGSRTERIARGNDLSMEARCNRQGINFWPIALEKDGCPSSSFLAFLKNVFDTAGKFTDQNPISFRNYWHARLACKFNHHMASMGLRRSLSFRRTLLRSHSATYDLHNTLQAQMTLPIHHSDISLSSITIPSHAINRAVRSAHRA